MRKLTLEHSEWLWAINRGKAAEYYAKRYGYQTEPSSFTKHIGGWIVKDILSSSDYLLKKAFEMFNMDFNLLIMSQFPDNKWGIRQELTREEICWLMFYSTAYSTTRKEMDMIVDGPWVIRWNKLDKEFRCK
jgi:hypothetical protein